MIDALDAEDYFHQPMMRGFVRHGKRSVEPLCKAVAQRGEMFGRPALELPERAGTGMQDDARWCAGGADGGRIAAQWHEGSRRGKRRLDTQPGEDGDVGGDAVLGLQVETGWLLDVTLQSTADAALYLVADCRDAATSCIAGADKGGAGEPETLHFQFHEPGTWYLILDHHGNGQGELTLTGDLFCEELAVQATTWTQVRSLYRE